MYSTFFHVLGNEIGWWKPAREPVSRFLMRFNRPTAKKCRCYIEEAVAEKYMLLWINLNQRSGNRVCILRIWAPLRHDGMATLKIWRKRCIIGQLLIESSFVWTKQQEIARILVDSNLFLGNVQNKCHTDEISPPHFLVSCSAPSFLIHFCTYDIPCFSWSNSRTGIRSQTLRLKRVLTNR